MNPLSSQDTLCVRITGDVLGYQVKVMDTDSREVLAEHQFVDASDLKAGLFLLSMISIGTGTSIEFEGDRESHFVEGFLYNLDETLVGFAKSEEFPLVSG